MAECSVDFHILPENNREQAWRHACSLIQKAYLANQTIHVHFSSKEEALGFDDLLWTYQEDSFIPHELLAMNGQSNAPVKIGYLTPIDCSGLLINCSATFPDFFVNFNQVIEIVFSDPALLQSARERYAEYRKHGSSINTHKL